MALLPRWVFKFLPREPILARSVLLHLSLTSLQDTSLKPSWEGVGGSYQSFPILLVL